MIHWGSGKSLRPTQGGGRDEEQMWMKWVSTALGSSS